MTQPTEEPQEERGAVGSRDQGGPPGSGPAQRPAGTSDAGDDTGVDPEGTVDPHSSQMPSGDQGG
jgi:hypothetical protein